MTRQAYIKNSNFKTGDRMAHLRKSNSIKFEELCADISATKQSVLRWEKGESAPPISIILKYCKKFDVSADYLLGLTDFSAQSDTAVQEIIRNQANKINKLKLLISSLYEISNMEVMRND